MTTFDAEGLIVREPREPKRNAMLGERIYVYETGSDAEEPILAIVTEANTSGMVRCSAVGVGRLRFRPKEWMRHMDDPHWGTVPSVRKHNCGAWDFHPIEGPLFDKHVSMAVARAHRGTKDETEVTV